LTETTPRLTCASHLARIRSKRVKVDPRQGADAQYVISPVRQLREAHGDQINSHAAFAGRRRVPREAQCRYPSMQKASLTRTAA
jgi:hypothetical protein